ncbi:MAG: hypothetical protein OXK17_05085 [Thaumarchaeota archaeon]|nr:hypothetical protein [Nitrososphaerota archaeon]
MAGGKKEKGGKKKAKKSSGKKSSSPVRQGATAAATTGPLLPFSVAPDLEHSWDLYRAALAGWTESAVVLQGSAIRAAASYLDLCHRAVGLDTELLKGAGLYWAERWQDACSESAIQHARAAAAAAASQGHTFRRVQAGLLAEYNRQWERALGL